MSEIIEIDGERYVIPCVIKDGKLTPSIENKIKLPIEIHDRFHINYRTDYEPPKSMLSRLTDAIHQLVS